MRDEEFSLPSNFFVLVKTFCETGKEYCHKDNLTKHLWIDLNSLNFINRVKLIHFELKLLKFITENTLVSGQVNRKIMAISTISIPSSRPYHDNLFMISSPLKCRNPFQTTRSPREVFSRMFRGADSTEICLFLLEL